MASPIWSLPELAAAPRAVVLGAELPRRFAGVSAECRAVRERAGVCVADFRTWVRLGGEDRVGFLQGMVSNDVRGLGPGEGCYAAVLTLQGRVVADLRIYAAGDHLLLDLPTAAAPAAVEALQRHIVADDVVVAVEDSARVALEGPQAPDVLARAGASWPGPALALAAGRIAGVPVRLATASHTGEAGVMVDCGASAAAAIWEALRGAGAEPVGGEALDVLRVEAGIPWIGVDMGAEMLVMEAGIENALSFTKGCYLGQEVVERAAARGQVHRRRVGIVVEGEPLPAGSPLSADGREVGWATSTVRSAGLAATIGMGYVRRNMAAPGTELQARAGAAIVPVRVARMPFLQARAATADVPRPTGGADERASQ